MKKICNHLKILSNNPKHVCNIFLSAALPISLHFVGFYISLVQVFLHRRLVFTSGVLFSKWEGFKCDLVYAVINWNECFVTTSLKFVYKVWGILRGITPFHTIWHTLIPDVIAFIAPPWIHEETSLSSTKPVADPPLQAHPICKSWSLQTSCVIAMLYWTT